MNSLIKKIIFLILGGGIALAAPINPQEMKWEYSFETIQFATSDGELGVNQYAIRNEEEWYVKTDNTPFLSTNNSKLIENKELVEIACEKCRYYDVFLNSKGEKEYYQTTKEEYKAISATENAPKPHKTEMVSVVGVSAAPTYDLLTETENGTVGTSVSFSHTTTGTNLALIVVPSRDNASTDTTTCTYNSVSMTQVAEVEGANTQYTTAFILVNPATGAHTVACSWATNAEHITYAISYTGVDQTTPNGTPVTSGGAATSETDDVTSGVEDLVVDFMGVNTSVTLAEGAGQTARGTETQDTSGQAFGSSEEAGGTTVTMSWTWGGGSQRTAHISFNLKAVAAAGAATTPNTIWKSGILKSGIIK